MHCSLQALLICSNAAVQKVNLCLSHQVNTSLVEALGSDHDELVFE